MNKYNIGLRRLLMLPEKCLPKLTDCLYFLVTADTEEECNVFLLFSDNPL
jgi:hypothetical protein